ncbi:hypothetical protein LJ725_14150 [Reyranella aquatilis]|uniref:Uncharacterized protein n=1 Tax=Reyranella aquatilis TaxID=2035356 RepID=A0ABS8KVL6_9HYPH|nr:hypothetical protein [Reyranella aquatilis]MCC8430114.1 hypothetical protein [Reyranella aquatilis]
MLIAGRVQYAGWPDSPDVAGLDGVHIKVKRAEMLRLYSVSNGLDLGR